MIVASLIGAAECATIREMRASCPHGIVPKKRCAACRKARRLANLPNRLAQERAYRVRHPEQTREANRLARARARRLDPEGVRARQREWYRINVEAGLLHSARARARRRGDAFTITRADVQIPTHCPVLGIPLVRTNSGAQTSNSPSLDQLVPGRGYVPGNVRVISWRANDLKRNATVDELRRLLAWLERELS